MAERSVQTMCPICDSELSESNDHKIEPCHHHMCKECIPKLRNLRCPLCNALPENFDIRDVLEIIDHQESDEQEREHEAIQQLYEEYGEAVEAVDYTMTPEEELERAIVQLRMLEIPLRFIPDQCVTQTDPEPGTVEAIIIEMTIENAMREYKRNNYIEITTEEEYSSSEDEISDNEYFMNSVEFSFTRIPGRQTII